MLEYEPNPMPCPYKDGFWHRNISELFLTDYRCKIFIVFLFWPYLLRMVLWHCGQLLTLQQASCACCAWRSIYYCLPLPFAGCFCDSFWLALFLLFAFKLSGYIFFACLDKNGFSKHKKAGSLKSENHQAISSQPDLRPRSNQVWGSGFPTRRRCALLFDRMLRCQIFQVWYIYGQKSWLARINFAQLGLQDIAPSLVEGGKHFSDWLWLFWKLFWGLIP